MTTVDKQAAIAALKADLDELRVAVTSHGTGYDRKPVAIASALGNARRLIAALEADDGRALLRQLREHVAEWQRLHEQAVGDPTVDQRVLQGYLAIERDVMDKIDRLLAAEPAQSAEPAAPASDDEARIAECMHRVGQAMLSMRHDWMLCVYDRDNPEDQKRKEAVESIGEAFALMRSLLARAVKAEGVLRAIDEVIADRGVPERDCTLPLPQRVDNLIVELKNWRHSYGEAALLAEKAETEIRHLRAKLAESEAEVERLRGRDAEPFDWDAAPNVQEWIDENLPEREPRAGSKMVELHADEVVADRGEARRVAGWLKDIMAENASLRAEADRMALAVMCGDGGLEVWNRTMTENADLRAKLAAAEKERDAAIAAQNALRSSPPAAPAGEAPAQGAGDDVLREVLVMPFRELISLDQEQRAIRVLTMGLKELCRRELARVGHHV